MSTKKMICGIAFIGFLICTFVFAGGVEQFIDLASILVVVILGSLFAIAVDGDDSFVQNLEMAASEQVGLGLLSV